MPKHQITTTLRLETSVLILKIQEASDFSPSIPQVIDAAVKLLAERKGVEA